MSTGTSQATQRGALVGYARASLDARLFERQLRTLADADCVRVFTDPTIGRTAGRPGLESCLASLHPGDVLVVATLGRLARSVHELIGVVARVRDRGAALRSLDGAIDTGGPDGRALLDAFTVLARYIGDAEAEAARDGRASARSAGQRLGRPPVLTPEQVAEARRLLRDPAATVASVARRMGIGRSTLYRHLPELTGRPTFGRTGQPGTPPSRTLTHGYPLREAFNIFDNVGRGERAAARRHGQVARGARGQVRRRVHGVGPPQ